MIQIPENYTEFLYWVKERTEAFWNDDPETSEEDLVCEDWAYGAKWIGMTDEEIDAAEREYNVKFSAEHREFLKILHTIDRKEKFEIKTSFGEDAEVIVREVPFFYNWLRDRDEIKKRLDWPYETILQDVLGQSNVWLESWGKKPDSDEEKEAIFSAWFQKAPKLVPITGHQFAFSDDSLEFKPLLSVYGSDIVIYGWNFRIFLINILQRELGFQDKLIDDEDCSWYPKLKDEIQQIFNEDFKFDARKDIPFWKELILIWNSGWSSFGMEFPGDNDLSVQPIRKTYVPEDEENKQKRFNDFK